jgi:hypothetical protein
MNFGQVKVFKRSNSVCVENKSSAVSNIGWTTSLKPKTDASDDAESSDDDEIEVQLKAHQVAVNFENIKDKAPPLQGAKLSTLKRHKKSW